MTDKPLKALADKMDAEVGSGPITHVVIARATDDHGGNHVQVKVTVFRSVPTATDVTNAEDSARKAYEWGFSEPPARYGAAALPYVEELDGDKEDECSEQS